MRYINGDLKKKRSNLISLVRYECLHVFVLVLSTPCLRLGDHCPPVRGACVFFYTLRCLMVNMKKFDTKVGEHWTEEH